MSEPGPEPEPIVEPIIEFIIEEDKPVTLPVAILRHVCLGCSNDSLNGSDICDSCVDMYRSRVEPENYELLVHHFERDVKLCVRCGDNLAVLGSDCCSLLCRWNNDDFIFLDKWIALSAAKREREEQRMLARLVKTME